MLAPLYGLLLLLLLPALIEKKNRCRTFVEDPTPTAQLNIGAYTLTKLKRCFSVFKAMVVDAGQAANDGSGSVADHRVARSQRLAFGGDGGHVGAAGKAGEGDADQLGGQVRRTVAHRARRHWRLGGLCGASFPLSSFRSLYGRALSIFCFSIFNFI